MILLALLDIDTAYQSYHYHQDEILWISLADSFSLLQRSGFLS